MRKGIWGHRNAWKTYAKCELVSGCLLRSGHCPKTNDKRNDIVKLRKGLVVDQSIRSRRNGWLTYHVKSIGHKSQRMREETRDNLDDEEGRVNGDHDLDPSTLGPSHLLKNTHCE